MAYKITSEHYEHEGRLWRYDLEARDNGNIANRTFYHPYTEGEQSPPADWMKEMQQLFLAELGVQQAFEDNPLNEDIRDELGEEYRRIITEMVKYVRANKSTLDDSGFKSWYDKRFPNSVFAFDKLLKLVMDKLNAKSFDEVKEAVITKKFVEVDE